MIQTQVQYVQSKLLKEVGVEHGWCMRYGGVSKGLFTSLNGKKGIGDPDENVDENRRRAIKGIITSQSGNTKTLAHIMHEFKDVVLEAKTGGEYSFFDASFTKNPELILSQTTADCASVIISDKNATIVALVHGSWHTLKAQIICKTVAKIKQHTDTELLAAIGPMICKKCYEFGPEASELFKAKHLTSIPHSGKFLVDLKGMVIDQLNESGITHIDDLHICNFEDERFFSHRRSGPNSGRIITLASPKVTVK